MRIYITIFILSIFSIEIYSQDPKLNTQSMEWRNIGPANMMGRIAAIDASNKDYRNVLIASASGGVFKSNNAGITWESIFDNYGAGSIGSVKFDQNNLNTIWVGKDAAIKKSEYDKFGKEECSKEYIEAFDVKAKAICRWEHLVVNFFTGVPRKYEYNGNQFDVPDPNPEDPNDKSLPVPPNFFAQSTEPFEESFAIKISVSPELVILEPLKLVVPEKYPLTIDEPSSSRFTS